MSSNNEDALREIDCKIQKIFDNAARARLDRVFSVLLTITIFVLGLLLNDVLSVAGLLRAWIIALMVLMLYTLVGEFDAILKNMDEKRVAFWMSLITGLYISLPTFLLILGYQLYPSQLVEIGIFVVLPFGFFFYWLYEWVAKFFTNFFNRLPSREFPHKAWTYFGRRIAIGILLFFAAFYITIAVTNFFGI